MDTFEIFVAILAHITEIQKLLSPFCGLSVIDRYHKRNQLNQLFGMGWGGGGGGCSSVK